MVECCIKLGHSSSVVQTAIEVNGGSFNSIKNMLDVVYKVEEEEINIDQVW